MVAQLGEQGAHNAQVVGSKPTHPTKFKIALVVESVDTGDSKSPAHKAYQFESDQGHHQTK